MEPDKDHPDRGYLYERIQWDRLERELATRWEKECGYRLTGQYLPAIIGEEPTRRDRFVAASVIQWLGTNCGFSFLQNALRESGYWIQGTDADLDMVTGDPVFGEIRQVQLNGEAAQWSFDLSQPT